MDIINFDDLNPVLDTQITTQYASRGVTFSPPLPLIFAPGAGGSTHFLVKSVFAGGSLITRSSHQIAGTLTESRHSIVRVKVGRTLNGFDTPIHFSAYDVLRNMVGSTTIDIPATTTFTFGEIIVSNPSISFFVLERTGNATADFFMDFLEFDDSHVPHSPDFRLVYSGPDLFLKPGASVSLEVNVLRLYGSEGNIRVVTSGGPPGLAVTSVAPNILNASDNDTTTINIIINENAPEAMPSPINMLNVTGFPDPTAGPTDVTVEIAINIIESYDLQIIGMEITQGIQNFDLPPKANPDFSGIVTYDGISLAANCRTTVLVYPSFRTLPSGPIPASFGVRLNGFSSMTGLPLPNAFLFPEALPSTIFRDDVVTPLARVTSGTRFTLPPSWTTLGLITLVAEIFDTSGSNSISPAMTSETNPNNNNFTTKNIGFFKTENLFISPIALTINDPTQPGSGAAALSTPQGPSGVFSAVTKLLPIDATKLVIQPYQATLNVTPAFLSSNTPAGRATAIAQAILSFADNNGFHETPRSFTIGVYSASFFANPTKVGGQTDPFPRDSGVFHHASEEAIAVVQDSGRPLTSVMHEVSHLCGRQHASAASRNAAGVVIPTGAQAPFESWPPDQLGWLQGVGFDVSTKATIYPLRFFHPETSIFQPRFDFMSYAANPNDLDSWLSPRGWEETLRFLRPFSETHPDAPQITSEKSTKISLSALVRFRVDDATQQATVEKVAPLENYTPRAHGTKESSYHVVLKAHNDADNVLARAHSSLVAQNPHYGFRHLQAILPLSPSSWDTLGSVEIYRVSTLLTTHTRPSHPPTITAFSITQPTDLDREYRIITWTATHPLPLFAILSYCNPRTTDWKDIYTTNTFPASFHSSSSSPSSPSSSSLPKGSPSHTHTHTIPLSTLNFPHNPTAQLRLTVSDNFNDPVTKLSDVFQASGSPPSVHIMSPQDGELVLSGCSVFLGVEGYEDWGGKIVGEVENEEAEEDEGGREARGGGAEDKRGIRWIVDGEVVARGAVGSWVCGGINGRGKGNVSVRVIVADYLGRETEREVGIVVF